MTSIVKKRVDAVTRALIYGQWYEVARLYNDPCTGHPTSSFFQLVFVICARAASYYAGR